MLKSLLHGFLVVIICNVIKAQTIVPDSTFAGNGLYCSATFSQVSGASVSISSDGKTILAGTLSSNFSNGYKIYFIQLNEDGTEDVGFGTNGLVKIDLDTINLHVEQLTDVEYTPDNKIVFCGSISDNGTNNRIFVGRLNSDGSPDSTFAGCGLRIMIPDLLHDSKANGIAVQEDGKILITGKSYNNILGNYDALTLRFNPNGMIDSTFANNGISLFNAFYYLNYSYNDQALGLKILPDESIIVYDLVDAAGYNLTTLFKINSFGIPDSSYGNNGVFLFVSSPYGMYPKNISLCNNSSVLLTGVVSSESKIIKITENGQLDSLFFDNGIIHLNLSSASEIGINTFLLDDNTLIVGGSINGNVDSSLFLLPVSQAGAIDSANAVFFNPCSEYVTSTDIVMDKNNRLYFAGVSGDNKAYIFRYKTITLSITENGSEQIRMYPNPADDFIRVNTHQKPATYFIFDISGKAILSGLSTNEYIHVSSLLPGYYILVLQTEGKQYRGAFVKE